MTSCLTSFVPRHIILCQAREFLRTVQKLSSSCWVQEFFSKTPWKKPKDLSLSQRREPWRFGTWLDRETSSDTWTGSCEGACLLWRDSEREKELFLSPVFSAWFLQVTFSDTRFAAPTVRHCRWSRWPGCTLRGSASFLQCALLVSWHTFCDCFVEHRCDLFLVKTDCAKPPSAF